MNFLLKIALIFMVLTQSAFAVKPDVCPPASALRAVSFNFARNFWDEPTRWTVKGKDSTNEIYLISDVVEAQSIEDAIRYANEARDNLIFVDGPIERKDESEGQVWVMYVCNYVDKAGKLFYAVYSE